MTPSMLLQELYGYGVKLQAANGRLVIDAPKGVITDSTKHMLQREKDAILQIITRPVDISYYRDLYEERVAIREYDGGLPRHTAEEEALISAYFEYLNNHPPILPYQFRQMIMERKEMQ